MQLQVFGYSEVKVCFHVRGGNMSMLQRGGQCNALNKYFWKSLFAWEEGILYTHPTLFPTALDMSCIRSKAR